MWLSVFSAQPVASVRFGSGWRISDHPSLIVSGRRNDAMLKCSILATPSQPVSHSVKNVFLSVGVFAV